MSQTIYHSNKNKIKYTIHAVKVPVIERVKRLIYRVKYSVYIYGFNRGFYFVNTTERTKYGGSKFKAYAINTEKDFDIINVKEWVKLNIFDSWTGNDLEDALEDSNECIYDFINIFVDALYEEQQKQMQGSE